MLKDFQKGFKEALLDSGESNQSVALKGPGGRAATEVLQIYRNNGQSVLRKSLEEAYPAVKILLGEAFDLLCQEYIDVFPSIHSDLERYGAKFSFFIASHKELEEECYLEDVARLEWAIHQKQTWNPVVGRIQIESEFPVFEIWRATLAGEDPDIDDGNWGSPVVVERDKEQVRVYEIAQSRLDV